MEIWALFSSSMEPAFQILQKTIGHCLKAVSLEATQPVSKGTADMSFSRTFCPDLNPKCCYGP